MSLIKHITILCSRLYLPGGIERAVVNTANLFTSKGHKVSLLILDETNSCFYPVHPEVRLIQQPLSFGISREGNIISRKIKFFTDVLKLKRILKQLQPDLIVATEYHFAAAAVLSGSKKFAKTIAWEHHHFYELKRNNFWNKIYKLTYPRLDAVVCLNIDEQKLFEHFNSNPVVIPNFIERSFKSGLNKKLLLTVGRLTHIKGTDLLLQSAKLVLQQHPDWQWKLIGEGDMKEEALSYIEKENLQRQVIIQPPVHHNILQEYQNASIYIMTSRNECLPMTLLEAQSVGLPCISFDCETGPRHIIINNETGLLVEKENPTALAKTITSLITDEERRMQMGKKAFENVQRFSPEEVYKQWKEKVFIL